MGSGDTLIYLPLNGNKAEKDTMGLQNIFTFLYYTLYIFSRYDIFAALRNLQKSHTADNPTHQFSNAHYLHARFERIHKDIATASHFSTSRRPTDKYLCDPCSHLEKRD